MQSLICLLILFTLTICQSIAQSNLYPNLVAETFTNIKNSPAERFVYFYFQSNKNANEQLEILNEAARRIHRFKPNFLIQYCDGDLPVNKEEFSGATFEKGGSWFFTSTPVEGIMKYTGPVTATAITRHIRHKYLPFNAEDVLPFTNEDEFFATLDADVDSPLSPEPSPIFVKFFEKWCQHCQRLAPTYSVAATVFKPTGVRFLEVECSLNEQTKAFCGRNDVTGYPALILFTGEKKIRYEEEMRSVDAFDRFFVKHVSNYQSIRKLKNQGEGSSDDKIEKPAASTPVRAAKEKVRPTRSSTQETPKTNTASPSTAPASPATLSTLDTRISSLESQMSTMQQSLDQILNKLDKLLSR